MTKIIKYSEIGTMLTSELSRLEVEQIEKGFKKKYKECSSQFMQISTIEAGCKMQFDGDGCYRKCWDEMKSSIPVLSHYEFVQ